MAKNSGTFYVNILDEKIDCETSLTSGAKEENADEEKKDEAAKPTEKQNEDKKEESVKQKPTEVDKYWKPVKSNPGDFTGWTYLLQYVEQEVSIQFVFL